MIISNSKTVGDLRAEFNSIFPYLKIEFYTSPYSPGVLLTSKQLIRHGAFITECRKPTNEGEFPLNPEHTVAVFEKSLWEIFGLSVQVFRKSGPLWIETSLTDAWTLKQQNFEGEQMSISLNTGADIDMNDRDQAE